MTWGCASSLEDQVTTRGVSALQRSKQNGKANAGRCLSQFTNSGCPNLTTTIKYRPRRSNELKRYKEMRKLDTDCQVTVDLLTTALQPTRQLQWKWWYICSVEEFLHPLSWRIRSFAQLKNSFVLSPNWHMYFYIRMPGLTRWIFQQRLLRQDQTRHTRGSPLSHWSLRSSLWATFAVNL